MINQQPPKRKRGRPKKYITNSSTRVSKKVDNLQDYHLLNLEPAMNKNTEVLIEDWEVELNDTNNEINLELLQDNTISNAESSLLNSESKDYLESTYLIINENPILPIEGFPAETDINDNQVGLELLKSNIISDEKDFINQEIVASKLPTTIHIIDGEKGGAGKSFFSRAFIEYCASIKYKLAIVDADISNQDIAKTYPGVELAFFSDDDKQAKEADKIFDMAFKRSVVVNLPAQVYLKVTNWITNNNLTELGKENSIYFVKWFVCTGGVDSVNFFIKSLDDLGESIPHVFVKNLGLCDDWEYVDNMPEFIAAKKKYQFVTMNFPKFPFWERNMIDRLEITFSDALSHPKLKVISKQRVKNFLKEVYTAFVETELVQ
jgi:hypothetical protein